MQEINNLRKKTVINSYVENDIYNVLYQRIDQYSNSFFNKTHLNFIVERQSLLDEYRKHIWNIDECGSMKGLVFTDYLAHCMKQLSLNISVFQKWVRELTYITLSQDEVINLFNNIKNFPALRTSLYTQFYLNFLIIKNGVTPSEDKFTDSLQVIPASYSSIFITNDKYIVNTLVPNLNPNQKSILIPTMLLEKNKICI